MQNPSDRAILEMTARILAEEPEISNALLLARLVAALGSEIATRFPVNRFERLVREPAMRAMRDQQIKGRGPEGAPRLRGRYLPEGSRVHVERPRGASPPAEDPPTDNGVGDVTRAGPEAWIGDVDKALIAAFALGASGMSGAEVIEAFRELGSLRARVRRTLERAV